MYLDRETGRYHFTQQDKTRIVWLFLLSGFIAGAGLICITLMWMSTSNFIWVVIGSIILYNVKHPINAGKAFWREMNNNE